MTLVPPLCSLPLMLLLAGALGGCHAGRSANGSAAMPTSGDRADPPHFSERALPRSDPTEASLYALHFARALAIRPHPSGDVVLLGCGEAPNDFHAQDTRHTSAFVARVDPSGDVRWVRNLNVGRDAFENSCYTRYQPTSPGPRLGSSVYLSVDDAGHVFVSGFASRKAEPGLIGTQGVERGTLVLSFADDGTLRWLHHVPADELVAVVGMVPSDDGGVDVMLRRHTSDGLDPHTLVHLDTAGTPSERASLTVAPMNGRDRACFVGPHGCSVGVKHFVRTSDGGFLLYGYIRGVELTIESSRAGSDPSGGQASGFWAGLEPDGRLLWLRQTAHVLESIVAVNDHEVLATVHPPSHEERTARIDVRTGERAGGSAGVSTGKPLTGPLGLYETQQRLMSEITWNNDYSSGVLGAEPIQQTATPRQLARLARVAPRGVAPEFSALGDGAFAQFMTLHGRLQIGEQVIASTHRMVTCHPGNVGEERSIPPGGCLEPLDRPSAVLIVWPATASPPIE